MSTKRPKSRDGAGPKTPGKRAEGGRPLARAEIAVLLAVALVRAVHWAGMLGDPLGGIPRMDPQVHDLWAQRIAEGHLAFDGPFFRAPLYPYFLGLLYAISGNSIPFAQAVQLGLGLVGAFLLFRIGARTFGRRIGLIAGAAYGIYPIALRTEGDLLAEGLFVLLALASLLAQLRAVERPTRSRWFATGLGYGLAAITRPTILLVALGVPAVTALQRRWEHSGVPLRRAVVEAAFLGFGVLAPILPVALHNGIVGHDFVPIASSGGVNFYIGNNPRADGFTAFVPGARVTSWEGWYRDMVALAEKDQGRPLRASEISSYYAGKGRDYLLTESGNALRLQLRKLYLFWWGAEISNNQHEYFLRRYSWPLRLTLWHAGIYFPFGLVAPLAFLGMAVAWSRRHGPTVPLLAYVALVMVSVVLFFVCARFRLPAVPILLLFAVYGAANLPDFWRRGSRRIGLLAAVAASFVFLNADPYHLNPAVFGSQALSYIDLGLWNASKGQLAEAERMLRQAAKHDPGNPIPHAWLGRFALQRGDLAVSETELRQAARADRDSFRDVVVQAQCDLGRLDLTRGAYAEARSQFEEALSLAGENAVATAGVGLSSLALGDTTAARSYLKRAASLDPGNEFVREALSSLPRPR